MLGNFEKPIKHLLGLIPVQGKQNHVLFAENKVADDEKAVNNNALHHYTHLGTYAPRILLTHNPRETKRLGHEVTKTITEPFWRRGLTGIRIRPMRVHYISVPRLVFQFLS